VQEVAWLVNHDGAIDRAKAASSSQRTFYIELQTAGMSDRPTAVESLPQVPYMYGSLVVTREKYRALLLQCIADLTEYTIDCMEYTAGHQVTLSRILPAAKKI